MLQRDCFMSGEGDAWFARNKSALAVTNVESDPVLSGLRHLRSTPKAVLEIGCANGWRLSHFHNTECFGLDPSENAIRAARERNPTHTYFVGTADFIPLPDHSVDLLVFGFCLYLADPKDHFRIIAEADRVLKDGGMLCIYDFAPGRAMKNAYAHQAGVISYKMEFAELFTAHPSYRRLHRVYAEHSKTLTLDPNEAVAADFLLKNAARAFG